MPILEMQNPTGLIEAALLKSRNMVSFGLQAADGLEIESLKILDSPFNITPGEGSPADFTALREEFRTWVIENVLRYCIEAIGLSLEWARKECFIWTRKGQVINLNDGRFRLSAKIHVSEWENGIVEEAKKFERLGLPFKLEHLEKNYGFPRPEWSDSVLSLNRARNCLTHRMGIVGEIDVCSESDPRLIVKWKRQVVRAVGQDGERILEIPTSILNKGEKASLIFVDVQKEFPLGTRVVFTPKEFSEITITFLFFARQIKDSINRLQKQRRKTQNNQ